MSKHTSFLQSALWLTAANFAMRAVSMVFQVYLSGAVGAAGIGLLQLILTVNGFAVTLGTSGLRVGAMYLSAEAYGLRNLQGVRQVMHRCLLAGTVLSTCVGLLLTLAAEPLALYWVKDFRAADSLRLLGLSLPFTCIGAVLAGYFTACGKVGRLAVVEILDRVASVGLTLWLLHFRVHNDLSHACVSVIGGSALASIGSAAALLYLMCRDFRQLPPSPKRSRTGRRIFRFCAPVAVNDYLRSGLGTLEQFLIPYGLSRSIGSRTAAMADYGTIHGMVFPILMFPGTVLFAVTDLLIPRLARSVAQKDGDRTRYLVGKALRAGTVFAAAVGGFLFVLSDTLGMLFYGSTDAAGYLRIFSPLVPVLYLDLIVDGIHKGLGQQIYCVRVNTLTNFLDVVLLFLLLPRFGIGGYIFTYTLTHAVNFYLSFRRLLAVTDTVLRIRFPACALCSTVLAAAAAASTAAPLLRCLIYLTVLTLLLLLTGAIDKPLSIP